MAVRRSMGTQGRDRCKICDAPAPLFGVVDFNKACIENQGKRLPLSGWPIYYRRCGGCGFVFTTAFDDWSHAEFGEAIYNAGYAAVDPDYAEVRPKATAALIGSLLGRSAAGISVLDWGAGNARLQQELQQRGFTDVTSYDPFNPAIATLPDRRFDLVLSFETLEHLPDPVDTIRQIAGCLKPDGACLFSTLVQPEPADLSWWYAAPRNGHISLFSKAALGRLWATVGLDCYFFARNSMQLATSARAPWLAHLFQTRS